MLPAGKNYDVIIAGAGPAGSSAAIHLANRDVRVLLVEQKSFPRAKLCGEFISPECLPHFERLGVQAAMQSSHPAPITETVFYSHNGRRIVVPSRWFGGVVALGLSRSEMDNNLLDRAKSLGVDVLEGAIVNDLIEDGNIACGVKLKIDLVEQEYRAPVVVDATGRARVLARRVDSHHGIKPKLVAFKAHLQNTVGSPTSCEIYSYPGGYGGLNTIENGLSNLCFIVDASLVKRAHSDPERVMRQNVMLNPRAALTLERASVCTDWLSVSLESFGRQHASPMIGLLAIGDSAAFIDPFTGSGMLMALESGELVSEVIVRHLYKLKGESSITSLCADYANAYRQKFDSRLRVCGLLRRVAFRPALAQLAITVCSASDQFRGWLARATRSSVKDKRTSVHPT